MIKYTIKTWECDHCGAQYNENNFSIYDVFDVKGLILNNSWDVSRFDFCEKCWNDLNINQIMLAFKKCSNNRETRGLK